MIGAIAVANSAYLAAVYLAADARRVGDRELEEGFRRRALATAVVAGTLVLGGLAVVREDAGFLWHGLVHGAGLACVVVSAVAGVTTFALVAVRRFELSRITAAAAVAAVAGASVAGAGAAGAAQSREPPGYSFNRRRALPFSSFSRSSAHSGRVSIHLAPGGLSMNG
jgi:hypothetical protein